MSAYYSIAAVRPGKPSEAGVRSIVGSAAWPPAGPFGPRVGGARNETAHEGHYWGARGGRRGRRGGGGRGQPSGQGDAGPHGEGGPQMQALEAELTRSQEAAAQAKRDLDRANQQYKDGILAEADRERTRSTYEQAVASAQRAHRQVEQARADIASAADSLAKTEIRAPMDGIVTRRNIEKGEVIVTGTMNNPGTVLMTISDMSTIEAVLEVDQTDVPQLRIGQPAVVRIDAFADERFPGEVSEIGSSPIQGTSALGGAATGTDYTVKVTLLKHPERIRPGLTVTADITTATRNDALTVPIGALVERQPETKAAPTPAPDSAGPAATSAHKESIASRARAIEGVYVVAGHKAEFRPVTTGIRGELDVEVTSGLKQGDEVIVGPFKALRDLKPGAEVMVDKSKEPGLE
ncbi:MAG: hypothetical protein B7Z68_12000 [Acidobacteria bacterium 21-70-11]|nr:MAG: hypothetical protein B7Z68_12000 [Acidobacteria bacterium 21-70-11]